MTDDEKRITVQKWRRSGDQYPDAVYIGRANPRYGLRASKWANPYHISATVTRDEAVARYVLKMLNESHDYNELQRKTLVCWCEDGELCHGDFLWDMANRDDAASQLGIMYYDVVTHWWLWAQDVLRNLDPGAENHGTMEETAE